MNRFISLSVLILLIVLLGSMFFQIVAPFVLPLFLAAVLAVICQPLHQYFLRKTGQRTAWAAALSTFTLVAIVVVPIVVGTFISAVQMYSLADQHLNGDWHNGLDLLWNRVAKPALEKVEQFSPEIRAFVYGVPKRREGQIDETPAATENEQGTANNNVTAEQPGPLSDEPLENLKNHLRDSLQSTASLIASRTFQLASSTVGMFVSMAVAAGMFITALYYFLADGPALITAAETLIPLPADYQRRLCERFATVVRAVVTATFMAAFVQGFATALAIQFCGIGYFWIFLVVATVASLIPLIGAWIVWVPCAAWLALQGHWTAAIMLSLWGMAVVGMLDNIVKVYMLQSTADLHPLLAFISVVGGLQVMGLWGIFIGPIMASCLYALIQIFNTELKELTKDRATEEAIPPPIAKPVSLTTDTVPTAKEVATVPSTERVHTVSVAPRKPKRRR